MTAIWGALTTWQHAALILLAVIAATSALYCLIEWLERHVLGDDDPVEQMVAALMEARR